MAGQQRYVDAREAAALLGISVSSLYAYVSRGLVRSETGNGGTRARRYFLEDIEALLARKEYRREPAKAAVAALGFGMPVLDSAITLIEAGRLYYRGWDVARLAQERSFEEVACLLWTGDFTTPGLFGPGAPVQAADLLPGSSEHPVERGQCVLALAATDDLAAHHFAPDAVARTGERILHLLTQAFGGMPVSQRQAGSIAATLGAAWVGPWPDAAALLSAALVLCADHELNVSAFTARCVASAGSTPYAVVIAALAALQGHRHGGHTARVQSLLDEAASQGVRAAVASVLRRGDSIPGFGHPLYPDGDPRAALLLNLLAEALPAASGLVLAQELCTVVEESLGLRPTIDLALAVLATCLDAPRHAPLALFALGRTAGWIAHACEQYALDQLIRPRARYVGQRP